MAGKLHQIGTLTFLCGFHANIPESQEFWVLCRTVSGAFFVPAGRTTIPAFFAT
jgi:hypothetical protein